MRYILGLCVVLAVGNPAWTSEMSNFAGATEYQTPAATVTSSVTQPAGTPASPAMSPAGAYQTATGQPATTTLSPAPTIMSPGAYTFGAQPVVTYATPNPNATYIANSYPAMTGNGMFTMSSPVVSYPSMPVTASYGAPVQTYNAIPGQTYYQPVQRRFGLFQRWRQSVAPSYSTMPVYGAAVYGAPVYGASAYPATGYPAATYAAPGYTTYNYSTPAYYATPYASPATTMYASPAMTMYASPTTTMYASPATTTVPASSMNTGATMAGAAATPVYTPTMLSVPNGTPAGAAPAEPPFQQVTPGQNAPTQTGASPSSGATPATTSPTPPPIPRVDPR